MNCPFVLCPNGDVIARVNPDGSWSVRWDRVMDIVYDKPQVRRLGVIAFAKLLLTARDNFIVTPWDADSGVWNHYQCEVNYLDHDPGAGSWHASISFNAVLLARVNYNGTWSVQWNHVADIARWSADDFRATALIGLSRLFMAAKDRFRVSPWEEDDDDE